MKIAENSRTALKLKIEINTTFGNQNHFFPHIASRLADLKPEHNNGRDKGVLVNF
jgi:hypothetical protein